MCCIMQIPLALENSASYWSVKDASYVFKDNF